MYDLHFHTTLSDGRNTTREMAELAHAKNLELIAVTEHDIVNRELRPYIHEYNAEYTRNGWYLHDLAYMKHVEWVEISTRYEDTQGKRRSLHIAAYALKLSEKLDDILTGIRHGRTEKLALQCETLRKNGFQIVHANEVIPFTLENLEEKYGGKKNVGIHIWDGKTDIWESNLNNAHIIDAFYEVPENIEKLQIKTGERIEKALFLGKCLRNSGKFTRTISLPHDLPEYEATLSQIQDNTNPESTVISLVHPQSTFASIADFETEFPQLVRSGVNGVEINNTATREWVMTILSQARKYQTIENPIYLTFGSDCHDINTVNQTRGEFGEMNPLLKWLHKTLNEHKEAFIEQTFGYHYRCMVHGIFS